MHDLFCPSLIQCSLLYFLVCLVVVFYPLLLCKKIHLCNASLLSFTYSPPLIDLQFFYIHYDAYISVLHPFLSTLYFRHCPISIIHPSCNVVVFLSFLCTCYCCTTVMPCHSPICPSFVGMPYHFVYKNIITTIYYSPLVYLAILSIKLWCCLILLTT